MKKIISALILTALMLSSILAIIPVAAAEEEAPEKVNVLMTSRDDQMNGVGPAFYYNYPLFNHDIGKYPVNAVPQEDGSTKGYQGNSTYMLRAVNAANGGATTIDGKLDTYAEAYHAFKVDGKDIIDNKGDTYHYESYLGISLKETKTVDSFKFYTVNEKTAGSKTLITGITLFGARVNPETHTFDANSWFKMSDAFMNVQETYTEDGNLAVVSGNLYMPFEIDYVFMAFNIDSDSGGEYNVVELELYEYAGGADSNIDFTALNEVITIAEAELAKENTYTTNSLDVLTKAYEDAKAALKATNQMAVDYASTTLSTAIIALTPLADTTELEAEIAKHASLVEATYTTSSWAAFATARDAAITLMETGNASETAVAESLAAITAAVAALAPKASATDLALLRAKFAEATSIEDDGYTSQSFADLKLAIRNTSQLTKDDNKDDVSVAQCEAAMKELVDAIAALVEKADLSALQAIVDGVLSINGKLYTDDSYAALASAISAAQQFLSGSASNASAKEAEALGAAITAAKEALVPLADFTALDAKIAELEALASADYTADSWKALQDAITAAKALKDTKATQEDTDKALAALETAAKALVSAADASADDGFEELGCGGVIGATAVVITAVLGLGAVALRRKDN